MSKPIPGQTYIVVAGDTFENIAARAYGDTRLSTRIIRANQSEITSSEPVPGQTLIIPRLAEFETTRIDTQRLQITGRADDSLTVLIDGLEMPVLSAHIVTAIDAVADGFLIKMSWRPGDIPELDKRLLPYSYNDAAIYIGTNLIVNGAVYTIATSLEKSGATKTVECWGRTADIIDSNLKPPYEQTNITLRQRAESLITPLGLTVVYDVSDDEIFDRVTAKPSDKIFSHLVGLATQRGILMTSNESGDVVFTRAAGGQPVGTLREPDPIVSDWNALYNGRTRFYAYKANAQSPGDNARTAVAIDAAVPKSRFMTFQVNDTTGGNIQQAADWRRSKQIANTLKLSLPVTTWFAPNGELWQKNTLVTVIAPVLHVGTGYTFLIRSVEFFYSADGRTAQLHLIPPELYTRELIIEPWS